MAICRWKSLTLDYSLYLELYLYGALHPFFLKLPQQERKLALVIAFLPPNRISSRFLYMTEILELDFYSC